MKVFVRPLKAAACVAVACLIWAGAAAGQAPVPASHSADLTGARVDTLADGTVVVSLDAKGELAGSLTLTLTPKGDGSYGGQWALMVAHTDNTDPATGLDPAEEEHVEHGDGEEHPHRDYVRYVHRGGMNGEITSATLSFGPDGLGDLSANITITQGALEFDGATGNGTATLSSLVLTY
jgi:hypothetical protein